jgi:hypothetical protein
MKTSAQRHRSPPPLSAETKSATPKKSVIVGPLTSCTSCMQRRYVLVTLRSGPRKYRRGYTGGVLLTSSSGTSWRKRMTPCSTTTDALNPRQHRSPDRLAPVNIQSTKRFGRIRYYHALRYPTPGQSTKTHEIVISEARAGISSHGINGICPSASVTAKCHRPAMANRQNVKVEVAYPGTANESGVGYRYLHEANMRS